MGRSTFRRRFWVRGYRATMGSAVLLHGSSAVISFGVRQLFKKLTGAVLSVAYRRINAFGASECPLKGEALEDDAENGDDRK